MANGLDGQDVAAAAQQAGQGLQPRAFVPSAADSFMFHSGGPSRGFLEPPGAYAARVNAYVALSQQDRENRLFPLQLRNEQLRGREAALELEGARLRLKKLRGDLKDYADLRASMPALARLGGPAGEAISVGLAIKTRETQLKQLQEDLEATGKMNAMMSEDENPILQQQAFMNKLVGQAAAYIEKETGQLVPSAAHDFLRNKTAFLLKQGRTEAEIETLFNSELPVMAEQIISRQESLNDLLNNVGPPLLPGVDPIQGRPPAGLPPSSRAGAATAAAVRQLPGFLATSADVMADIVETPFVSAANFARGLFGYGPVNDPLRRLPTP
jgi:hypothetical protein